MLETSMAKLFESKKVLASDDDYRQVHAHTHTHSSARGAS